MQLARSSRRACVAFGNFIFFCFFCCFLLFLPGTIFIVMPYRTALVLSSKMASSANTGPWYEPARQRGYFNFGVCLGLYMLGRQYSLRIWTVFWWFGNTTRLLTHCFCKLARSILAAGFVQLFQQGSKKSQHWILRRNCASESRNFLTKGFIWGQPRVDRWRLPNLSVGR